MADLRVKSTGKEFRRIDNGTALLLEEMFPAALERINEPIRNSQAQRELIPNYTEPLWGVNRGPSGDPVITLLAGRAVFSYPGSVEGAAGHFKRAGFDLPPAILEQYAKLCNTPLPSVCASDDELNQYADAQAKNR